MKVESYQRKDGTAPFDAWFLTLDIAAALKISDARAKMEAGNLAAVEWWGAFGEYKIDWGPGYRIYLGRKGEGLILLLGGSKKRQQNDINLAKTLYTEFQARSKEEAEAKKKNEKYPKKKMKQDKKRSPKKGR